MATKVVNLAGLVKVITDYPEICSLSIKIEDDWLTVSVTSQPDAASHKQTEEYSSPLQDALLCRFDIVKDLLIKMAGKLSSLS